MKNFRPQALHIILNFRLHIAFILLWATQANLSYSQTITLDHVITLKSDLNEAVGYFSDLGFSIKSGRLHSNGLSNAHIKFSNQSSLEIMTIRGEPTDQLAKNYASLLQAGEGGVFLALAGQDTTSLIANLTRMELPYIVTPGKSWSYVSFPEQSGLAHLFFIEYHYDRNQVIDVYDHRNGAQAVENVMIEGGANVLRLLSELGLATPERISDSEFGDGQRFRTESGYITVIPIQQPGTRPRIRAISFNTKDQSSLRVLLN